MVKGCERRLVIYKSKSSKYFSEVHFIMKEEIDSKKERRRDIIAEANKIVDESLSKEKHNKKKKKEKLINLFFFISGIALSAPVFILLTYFNLI